MNYQELLAKVNADFNVTLTVCKEKAGYLMLSQGGTLGNRDCGHSCPARQAYVELPSGWGYILEKGDWKRLRNGCVGYRRGEECEFGKTLPDATIDPWTLG